LGSAQSFVDHARYVALQMAEVTISKILFAEILGMIAKLRPADRMCWRSWAR
jgi:hypothetical protein